MADNTMDRIKHLVVVMMENRSFDSLVGFLYAKEKNVPPANIRAPPPGQQPSYDGLTDPNPDSDFWIPPTRNISQRMRHRRKSLLLRARPGRNRSSCRTMTRGRNLVTSAFKFSARKTGVGHG